MKLEPEATVQAFKLAPMTSFCVSTVIFANDVASARLLLGLKVMVNDPLPLDVLPESAVTPEIYPNVQPDV